MFRGIASASLDAKGRMPVPTLYREELSGRASGKVVVTIDLAILGWFAASEFGERRQQVHG